MVFLVTCKSAKYHTLMRMVSIHFWKRVDQEVLHHIGSNIWFHTSNKNSQKNLANLFDDPAIPCRQTLGNDEPTGPPLFPTQCTTAWSKQIHFEGLQGFDESKQLKCCDSGCVKNLANAEFCPEHAPEAAALVENSDSRANGILVRDCKVRGFVPLNILTQLIEHTFVDDCYWTMDCVYTVICKVDNSTCQG